MSYSSKLTIADRVKNDGTAALFFQILINRKKTTVPTGLYWPAHLFDKETRELLPASRDRDDQKAHQDYTVIIKRIDGKINDVFRWYLLAEQELTIELFERDLANFDSRQDFLLFWQQTVEDNYEKGLIKKGSWKQHRSSLEALKLFKSSILFSELSIDLIEDYRGFMRRKLNYAESTIWCRLKDLRTYVNWAKKKKIVFSLESKEIKLPKTKGRIIYLNDAEFKRVLGYFNSNEIEKYLGQKRALRAFLFSCYTGLRISDLQQVTWQHIDGDFMDFTPVKTQGIVPHLRIPLSAKAQALIESKKGLLLDCMSDQKMNDHLKEIAIRANVKKNLTMHVGRHTFATRLLSKGGKLERLKELLGHLKIESTMIYVHVSETDLQNDVNLL